MDHNASTFRSRLGQVRGHGSAKHGSGSWIADRIAALTLIPLTCWFVMTILRALAGKTDIQAALSPVNAILLLLFINISIYHGYHGIKVVVEDYVHKPCVKNTVLILTLLICIASAVVFTLALIIFHLLSILPTNM